MSSAEAIYLDNNATTAVAPEALEAMLPWLGGACGNPSSQHRYGAAAAQAVSAARVALARLLGAAGPDEVLFCSGATEALATALHSALVAAPERRRVLLSTTEHSAVRAPLARWQRAGRIETQAIAVDGSGALDLCALERALARGDVAVVALLYANNETGVVLEPDALARLDPLLRASGARLVLDTVQAAGKLPLALAAGPADYAALSAHKFHGPKGVGALWVRRGAPLEPLLVGGGQERDRRAGTENVPGIVGMGKAAELASAFLGAPERVAQLAALRDGLEARLCARVPGCAVHGSRAPRLWNTSSLAFPGLQAEALQALLDLEGVAVSTGAACSSGLHAPSHVLLAMGVAPELAAASLRISLSRFTSPAEIERAGAAVEAAAQALMQLGAGI